MNENQQAIEAAKPKPKLTAVVDLETPIIRGEQTIQKLTLRKPVSGELRGVALHDLLKLDVGAMIVVLPRITTPALTEHDAGQLDLVDLVAIGAEIVGFFASKSDKASPSPAT